MDRVLGLYEVRNISCKERETKSALFIWGFLLCFVIVETFIKKQAKYVFTPNSTEYSKIIVSLYLSGCFQFRIIKPYHELLVF